MLSITRCLLLAAVLSSLGCGGGGATGNECSVDRDCVKTNPDVCNICPADLMNLVCHVGTCACACQVK
jgi:hypothetical protein